MPRRTGLTPPAPDSSGGRQEARKKQPDRSDQTAVVAHVSVSKCAGQFAQDTWSIWLTFGTFVPPDSTIIPRSCGIVNSIVKKSLCRAGAVLAWAWLAVACSGCAALRRVGNRLFASANSRPRAKKKRAARLRLKLAALRWRRALVWWWSFCRARPLTATALQNGGFCAVLRLHVRRVQGE